MNHVRIETPDLKINPTQISGWTAKLCIHGKTPGSLAKKAGRDQRGILKDSVMTEFCSLLKLCLFPNSTHTNQAAENGSLTSLRYKGTEPEAG